MKTLISAVVLCLLGCADQTPAPKKPQDSSPLAKQVKGKTSSEWINLLADNVPEKRLESAKALAAFDPEEPGVGDALFGALKDPNDAIQLTAGIAILAWGDKAIPLFPKQKAGVDKVVVPLDPEKVPNPSPGKAPNPSKFLGPLSPAEELVYYDPWFAGTIIPGCVRALTDEDANFRVKAVKALEILVKGSDRAPDFVIDALKKASNDADESVRKAAIELLSKLEAKRASPPEGNQKLP